MSRIIKLFCCSLNVLTSLMLLNFFKFVLNHLKSEKLLILIFIYKEATNSLHRFVSADL